MSRYAIICQKSRTGYSAYVPDLPGCVAAASTLSEAQNLIRESIEFHLEGMREDGAPVPAPTTVAAMVDVTAV